MQMCYFVFVFMHAWQTLLLLCVSMLSKCDDVITYAKEPLNIQTRNKCNIPALQHFLKHSDRISSSKVLKHLRTIVIFSRGRMSRSLRVK